VVVQKELYILKLHHQVKKQRLEPNAQEQNISGWKVIGDGIARRTPISGFMDIGSKKKKERTGFMEAGNKHRVGGNG